MIPIIITATRATEIPAIIPAIFAVTLLSVGVPVVSVVALFLLVVVETLSSVGIPVVPVVASFLLVVVALFAERFIYLYIKIQRN